MVKLMQMVKYKKREKIYLIQQQGIDGINLRMKIGMATVVLQSNMNSLNLNGLETS